MRHIFVTATLLLATTAPAQAAGGLQCPASLTVQAQPDAPGGWSPYPGRDSHGFAGISLVEGDRASEMTSASPATLAPDREVRRGRSIVQVWEFTGTRRRNVFLVCRYRDTQATLAADLPSHIRRCTLTLATDIRGTVLDDPKTPPQLDCR